MGIWDTIHDLVEAAVPWSTAEAEAPAEDNDSSEEEAEEEEDEEEIEDPKEKLEEECKNSKACAPAKHHFDECVERVTGAEDSGESKEDCVEEFFHLAHCASQCAAPKLWSVLK
ncbi:Non-heme 11 kDa protein of cytochrome bc1 complex [Jackrogersella minutella]|nr:Non-heme 11 kDa protein of cytochrome bc1 complex [Jackrogersella minutella]